MSNPLVVMSNPFGLRMYHSGKKPTMIVSHLISSSYVNPRNHSDSKDIYPLTHDYEQHMKSREVLEEYRG